MSIIQEALKKAQRKSVTVELAKNEPAEQDLIDQAPSYMLKPINKKKSKPAAKSPGPRIALYGAILACVVIVLIIKYYPSKPVKNVNAQIASLAGNLRDPINAMAEIPTPVITRAQGIETAGEIRQLIKQGDFKLSGIMDLEDGRRAIINNLMVAEGDSIGSVKIETITADSVTLKKGGNSFTLQLK